MSRLTSSLLIIVIVILAVVQVPIDLRSRRLSRYATIVSLLSIGVILLIDSWMSSRQVDLAKSVVATFVVLALYWITHFVSPHSLGFGDVLLTIPLTLAVGYGSLSYLLWWQLLAASTGAVHAVFVQIRIGRDRIPFGPHLLLTAVLTLAVTLRFKL